MKRRKLQVSPVICFVGLLCAPLGLCAETVVLKGQILDANASAEAFRSGPGVARGFEWFVPLADQPFEVALLPAPSGGVSTWSVQSDGAGNFELDTGLTSLPPEARLVATCERGKRHLFSPSFLPQAKGVTLFLYETTDAADAVNCDMWVVHDLVDRGEEKLFRVRVVVSFTNTSNHLYVGSKRPGDPWRHIFRLPVPQGATILENSGPFAGVLWRPSADGRSMVIDEPLPGFSDLAVGLKEERRRYWSLEYVVPAHRSMSATYAFPVTCSRLAVYGAKDEVKVVPTSELATPVAVPKDPITSAAKPFNAYGLKTDKEGRGVPLEAGSSLVVALELNAASLGVVSLRALKWHAGFVLVCLVAMLLGMILSPRKPPEEAVLAGLSRDQLLDRIAQLDVRFKARKIKETEYRRYREALVGIAAEDLQAASEASGQAAPAAAPTASGSSPNVEGLITRIRELDGDGAVTPQAVQERAHLLEALYKVLNGESSR